MNGLTRLRGIIPEEGEQPAPKFFVKFGPVPEKVLEAAEDWNADLILLGLHAVENRSLANTTWAKAYEIVRQANCPVLTLRRPP